MRRCVVLVAIGLLGLGWLAHRDGATARPSRPAQVAAGVTTVPTRATSAPVRMTRDGTRQHFTVLDFVPAGTHTAWAVTEGDSIHAPRQAVLMTTDGGAHWQDVTPPSLTRATLARQITSLALAPSGPAWIGYGSAGGPQTLLVSANDGHSWRTVGRLPSYCALQFVNTHDGWCTSIGGAAGSEFVTIFRTTTGGQRWRRIEVTAPTGRYRTPDAIPFACDKAITFLGATEGFASSTCNSGEGFIDVTRDAGVRWTPALTLPASPQAENGRQLSVVAGAGRRLAVAETIDGASGPQDTVILVSDDAGAHWRSIQPPSPHRVFPIDLVSARVWRLVAGRHILATDDAGASWHTVSANVRFTDADSVLYTTRSIGWSVRQSGAGGVLRTTDGGARWSPVPPP